MSCSTCLNKGYVDSAFHTIRFLLNDETRLLFLFGENLIFRKRLGVTTYFCFIFEGKNKIRKKNPKYDS